MVTYRYSEYEKPSMDLLAKETTRHIASSISLATAFVVSCDSLESSILTDSQIAGIQQCSRQFKPTSMQL